MFLNFNTYMYTEKKNAASKKQRFVFQNKNPKSLDNASKFVSSHFTESIMMKKDKHTKANVIEFESQPSITRKNLFEDINKKVDESLSNNKFSERERKISTPIKQKNNWREKLRESEIQRLKLKEGKESNRYEIKVTRNDAEKEKLPKLMNGCKEKYKEEEEEDKQEQEQEEEEEEGEEEDDEEEEEEEEEEEGEKEEKEEEKDEYDDDNKHIIFEEGGECNDKQGRGSLDENHQYYDDGDDNNVDDDEDEDDNDNDGVGKVQRMIKIKNRFEQEEKQESKKKADIGQFPQFGWATHCHNSADGYGEELSQKNTFSNSQTSYDSNQAECLTASSNNNETNHSLFLLKMMQQIKSLSRTRAEHFYA